MKPVFRILISAPLLVLSVAFADDDQARSDCFILDRECIAKEKIRQRRADADARETARREKYLQDKSQREAAREEEVRVKVEQAAQARRETEEQKQAKAEEERQKREAQYQQIKAEQARQQAEMEAEAAADDKRERAAKKKRDVDVAELKARCGSDYKTPSIGMSIGRVQECVGPVKLSGQVNRPDGVASVYTYGPLWVNVMAGRVIAWGQ
jgi:multidrug efflux pump subunit AcrA (membrane-fusion protein)